MNTIGEVPIFVPGRLWAYGMQRALPWGMTSYAGQLPNTTHPFPVEPWFNAQEVPAASAISRSCTTAALTSSRSIL